MFNRVRTKILWLVLGVLAAVLLKFHPLISSEGTRIDRDWGETHQVDAIQLDVAMKKGCLLPFWSPYTQGGCAVYAVPTKPYAYPPFLLAVWLMGPFLGMNILTFLHIFLGGLGTLWLMRRLGTSYFASLVAAFLFALTAIPGSLFLSAPFWGYAVTWWPFAFICVLDIVDGRKWVRSGILLGVLFALQLLAGGEFPLYWMGCFLGAFILPFVFKRKAWPLLGRLAAAGLLVGLVFIGLSAVKLLPALEWLKTSGRQAAFTDEEIFFGSNYKDITAEGTGAMLQALLLRKGAGLVVIAALIALGLATRFKERAFWAVVAGTLFCLALALALVHELVRDLLPGYDRMRMPYRFAYAAGMGGILLAGFGLDGLWKIAGRWRPALLKLALPILIIGALLFETRLVPGMNFQPPLFFSYKSQHAIARPSYEPILKDPRHGRIHFPMFRNHAIWTLLEQECVTGRLGGRGSGNAVFIDWLPLDLQAFTLTSEYGKVLDILNVRYLASVHQLPIRKLKEVFAPEPVEVGWDADHPDAFAAKVRADGTGLEYCGYIGGLERDYGRAVAVDGDGRAHVAGQTYSREDRFPATSPDPTHNGGSDGFVARIGADGRALEYCTYLGGEGFDDVRGIALDAPAGAVVAGKTTSRADTFPCVAGPGLFHQGGVWDAFVARVGSPEIESKQDGISFAPLHIIENHGQIGGDVSYYVQGSQKTVFFGPGGLTYLVTMDLPREGESPARQVRWCLKLDFASVNRSARPEGAVPLPVRYNFLKGPPREWKADVPCFGKVVYPNLWPGVDLEFAVHEGRLKSNFILRPGSDPARIRMTYQGATELEITEQGSLAVLVRDWTVLEDAPLKAYQIKDGSRVEVEASYRLHPRGKGGIRQYGFSLGAFDTERPLYIDPEVLLHCGYLGGPGDDVGYAVAVDAEGCAFVAGQSDSAFIACPAQPGPLKGARARDADAFVAKVDAKGSSPVYFTFIGGSKNDCARDIALDGRGFAYITGTTVSDAAGFPAKGGPCLTPKGKEEAFVAKLSPDGSRLSYCGFIGGSEPDSGLAVAVDSEGCAVVAGETRSREGDFPTFQGPCLSHEGETDAFLAMVDPKGASLKFCGYIGGEGKDSAHGLAVDKEGRILVAGVTESSDSFPRTVGPDLSFNGGGMDCFIARVAKNGRAVDYCGYIGGAEPDMGYDVAVDEKGCAYLTGMTFSDETSFPVSQGPVLKFAQSIYRRHLRPLGPKVNFEPYIQAYVYERKFCLERASMFNEAILVVGKAEERGEAVKRAVCNRGFRPNRTVFVERFDVEDDWPDAEDAEFFKAVLFAGRAIDDPSLFEWHQRIDRGAFISLTETDTLWKEESSGEKGVDRLKPLDAKRYVNNINTIEVDLEGMEGRFLLLSELLTLHPGWRAFVDGEPAKLYRADGLITAIRVPPGAMRARFAFTPPGFVPGAWISAVTVLLLAIILTREYFFRRKE